MSLQQEQALNIVVERELPHPPQKVWRALTDSSLIQQWMMENDFKAQVGHNFQFRHEPVGGWNGITDCEVLVVEPNEQLKYTWNPWDGLGTTVTWTLSPAGEGTHLRMEQTGFKPDQQANLKGAQYGWNLFVGNFEKLLGEID